MSWDFLCTFHKSLSLETISFDDFVSALIYQPAVGTGDEQGNDETSQTSPADIPVFLGEVSELVVKLSSFRFSPH
jgi:hypothetical protein